MVVNVTACVLIIIASGDDEVLIQLRILSLSCLHWQVCCKVVIDYCYSTT